MSDDDAKEAEEIDGEDGADAEGEDGKSSKKRKLPGKKLVMFILLPVLVLGGGGYFAASMLGFLGGGDAGPQAANAPAKKLLYYDLPEMLVNLSNQDSRSRYLKLKVSLEMTDSEARAALAPRLPRVLDTFQVFLREMRPADLEGSAGVYRLKEELTRRVNVAIRPRKIDRVLFKEMLIQ